MKNVYFYTLYEFLTNEWSLPGVSGVCLFNLLFIYLALPRSGRDIATAGACGPAVVGLCRSE